MFRRGQTFKVKLEISPEQTGYGRAEVIDADSRFVLLKIKGSKGEAPDLINGVKIWFVDNLLTNRFNGLWSSVISGSKEVQGENYFECRQPKFAPALQKRKQPRVDASFPLLFTAKELEAFSNQAVSRNLSRSGIGITVKGDVAQHFEPGSLIEFSLQSQPEPIQLKAQVIRAYYDWLSHDTEIGLAYVELPESTKEQIEQMIQALKKIRGEDKNSDDKTKRTLAQWLRSDKENSRFIKTCIEETKEVNQHDS
ncbi:MAG: PilZ domain-containing protein [Candidatus Obscuribacterales bacterium]|nr:PilZ domain-containing protein [Candidatus Obscuribacterales bacterium]